MSLINSKPEAERMNGSESDEKQLSEQAEQRHVWGGKVEFLLSCLSYAIGLGNIWRFPYLCYMNGGAAFLLPFLIMLFLIGVPALLLETYIGQYWSTGPVTVWRICPIFGGLGWAMIVTLFLSGIYYQVLISWTLYYIVQSCIGFFSQVPWAACPANAATDSCVTFRTKIVESTCLKYNGYFSFSHNNTCLMPDNLSWHISATNGIDLSKWRPPANASSAGVELAELYNRAAQLNRTALQQFLGATGTANSAGDYFFRTQALDMSEGLETIGWPKWQLVIALLAAWIITALCLVRGVKSAGKVSYFTATFPYVVLTVLLIRGLTLEGSAKGLAYFFIPKWHRLLDLKVWADAAIQVFFTLSSGCGGIIALSSYNKFHNNALFDAIIVALGDGFTSIYGGSAVFCVLGYMSYITNLPIDEVVTGGAGLAFIAYPNLVTTLPLSPLWAILFFGMMATLGFGTIIANVNAVMTAILDCWFSRESGFFSRGFRSHIIVLVTICTAEFLLGLSMTTRAGVYIIQLMDNNCSTYTILVGAFSEMVVIMWVYGADRFMGHVTEMRSGNPLPILWKILWQFFAPAIAIIMLAFKIFSLNRTQYGGYTVPLPVDFMFGQIPILIVLIIPVYALVKVVNCKEAGSIAAKITYLSKPEPAPTSYTFTQPSNNLLLSADIEMQPVQTGAI